MSLLDATPVRRTSASLALAPFVGTPSDHFCEASQLVTSASRESQEPARVASAWASGQPSHLVDTQPSQLACRHARTKTATLAATRFTRPTSADRPRNHKQLPNHPRCCRNVRICVSIFLSLPGTLVRLGRMSNTVCLISQNRVFRHVLNRLATPAVTNLCILHSPLYSQHRHPLCRHHRVNSTRSCKQ